MAVPMANYEIKAHFFQRCSSLRTASHEEIERVKDVALETMRRVATIFFLVTFAVLRAYVHTFVLAYLRTCVLEYMRTCVHAYMRTCVRAYIRFDSNVRACIGYVEIIEILLEGVRANKSRRKKRKHLAFGKKETP